MSVNTLEQSTALELSVKIKYNNIIIIITTSSM